LLPALAQARATARTSQCLSLLRQFALANDLYAMASEGRYAPARLPDATAWHANRLYRAGILKPLQPALNWHWDPDYLCPASRAQSKLNATTGQASMADSYGM